MEPFGSHVLARQMPSNVRLLAAPNRPSPASGNNDPRIQTACGVTAVSVHEHAWASGSRQKRAQRRRGASHSYDVLALGPIAEESFWDRRQAVREEWVLSDSIHSLHENQPANPLFAVSNHACYHNLYAVPTIPRPQRKKNGNSLPGSSTILQRSAISTVPRPARFLPP
jgi:hypothetical protein